MTESFILGLSSGSACLVTCSIVMFPYLMMESAGVRRIVTDLTVFMTARLIIYLLLSILAWYFGQAFFTGTFVRNIVPGVLYILFAFLLVWYSIDKARRKECPGKVIAAIGNKKLIPFFLGIINSIGFCPALFLVLTKGATESTLTQACISFMAFFIGSSVWFLPLPFAGKIRRKQAIETIGNLATGLAGTIFIIKGISLIAGGILNG